MQSEDKEVKRIFDEKVILQQKLKSVNEEIKSIAKTTDVNHEKDVEPSSQNSLKSSSSKPPDQNLKKNLLQGSFTSKPRDAVMAETSAAAKEHKVIKM